MLRRSSGIRSTPGPRSELRGQALSIIEEAREKLAAKQARVGGWYYERKLYESSIIYFESLVQEYPDAAVVPSVLLQLHDAYSQVGFRAEADAVREALITRYPGSQEAESLAADPTDASEE